MSFDARAFDRAQRRKLLSEGKVKPTVVRPKPKASKPRKPYAPRKYVYRPPMSAWQRRRKLDDARIERKVEMYAEDDKMCDDVLAILESLCEKMGR